MMRRRRLYRSRWVSFHSAAPCLDCGRDTAARAFPCYVRPSEFYMVHDEVWQAAGAPEEGYLCVGCLERRLGRELTPSDFPEIPINDDNPDQSRRLSSRKGLGRCSADRLEVGVALVLDSGRDLYEVAAELAVYAPMLAAWVDAEHLLRERGIPSPSQHGGANSTASSDANDRKETC